jgi:hypothetical protein
MASWPTIRGVPVHPRRWILPHLMRAPSPPSAHSAAPSPAGSADEVLISRFSHRAALVLCDGNADVSLPRPSVSCFFPPSPPLLLFPSTLANPSTCPTRWRPWPMPTWVWLFPICFFFFFFIWPRPQLPAKPTCLGQPIQLPSQSQPPLRDTSAPPQSSDPDITFTALSSSLLLLHSLVPNSPHCALLAC